MEIQDTRRQIRIPTPIAVGAIFLLGVGVGVNLGMLVALARLSGWGVGL